MNKIQLYCLDMKAIFFISICLLCSSFVSYAYRAPDSCLKKMRYADGPTPGQEYRPNPDSVRIDSCSGSPTFGLLYAKKRFNIVFRNHKIMYYGNDTLFGIEYHKTWQDILPQFTAIKSIFAQLELLYGTYSILRMMPATGNYSDTVESAVMSREYFLEFDNYVPIDSVVTLLGTIQDIGNYYYMSRLEEPTSISEEESGSTKTYMIGTQSFCCSFITTI